VEGSCNPVLRRIFAASRIQSNRNYQELENYMVKLVFKSGAVVDVDIEIISIGRDAQGQTVSFEWKAKSQRVFKLDMEDVSCIIDDTPVMNGGESMPAPSAHVGA
jgi:hypothetical protein